MLRAAGRRLQPAQDAAEADEADAVAALEVLVGERGGGAHREVERAPLALRTSTKLSRNRTTSLLRSGCCSFTYSSPRRALTRQFTWRTRSPDANGRRSANSIPSPRVRATRSPERLRLERAHEGPQPFGPRVRAQGHRPLYAGVAGRIRSGRSPGGGAPRWKAPQRRHELERNDASSPVGRGRPRAQPRRRARRRGEHEVELDLVDASRSSPPVRRRRLALERSVSAKVSHRELRRRLEDDHEERCERGARATTSPAGP